MATKGYDIGVSHPIPKTVRRTNEGYVGEFPGIYNPREEFAGIYDAKDDLDENDRALTLDQMFR